MVYQRGDPRVREWMKGHPDEVERIEKLYGILKDMPVGELTELARFLAVDVARYWAQYRDRLIADIVKSHSSRALEIVAGQGILLSDKGLSKQKRG